MSITDHEPKLVWKYFNEIRQIPRCSGNEELARRYSLEFAEKHGFEAEADKVQELFLAGKKAEAVQAVPDQLADEISLVGPVARIRERLQAWRETPVTSLLVSARSTAELRTLAELVLG